MGWLRGIFLAFLFRFFFFFIIIVFMFLPCISCKHENDNCQTTNCSMEGPEIRFPFRMKGSQQRAQWCSYPGFELSCKGNDTILQLPSSQEVLVRHIYYSSQSLQIVDSNSKGCNENLLFHLNLSSSPFSYSSPYGLHNYTFLNCSPSVHYSRSIYSESYSISCMKDLGHHVLLFGSDSDVNSVPLSCQPTKTIEIPSPELTDPLYLKWDMPGCSGCDEAKGGMCGFKYRAQTTNETKCFYPHGPWKKYVIIGVGVGSFVTLVASLISLKFYYSWKLEREKDRENNLKVEKFLEDYKSMKPTRYSYADLKKMTDQFKDKLGEGGYGSVYKGKLAQGNLVAVKILHKSGGDGEDFINEVGTIGRIHHINVVRLLGFCTDNLNRALIYEFMPNESLEKFIFSADTKSPLLSWGKLQDIAIGIARGIEYLHQGCDQRILHFDIKPHNILLDHNFNPKISDFGLAKLCSKGQSIVSMTAARGTMGYIAPEVFSRNFGNVSYKSDVYSFGMLLLEMVGGRKNIDVTVENTSQVYFPEWIYDRLHQGEELGLNIISVEDANVAKKLTTVALWCIQWYPVGRPAMKSVVQMLEGSVESLMMPPNPFASSAPPNVDTIAPETTHVANLTTIVELEEGKEEDIA